MIKLALMIFAVIATISAVVGFLLNRKKVQEVTDGALVAGNCLFRLAIYGLILSAGFFLLLKVLIEIWF